MTVAGKSEAALSLVAGSLHGVPAVVQGHTTPAEYTQVKGNPILSKSQYNKIQRCVYCKILQENNRVFGP
jgi:hypothetical protein